MLLLYDFILIIAALARSPSLLYQHWRYGKYPQFLQKKWGIPFKKISKNKHPLVWIHAVSVGETRAVATLLGLLKKKYPHVRLLVTSTTETGHKEAQRSIPFADHHLFLPFDFSWIIQPLVKRLKPKLVLLVETDYWYNFMQASKEAGAAVALLNGKLSERSMKRYQWLGRWLQPFFAPLDLLCLQSNQYVERFARLAIPSSKMVVTGNLKLDAPAKILSSEALAQWKTELKISPNDFVIVSGSTHAPEEQLLINVLQELLPQYPQLKLILIPRHPERFPEVAALLNQANLNNIALSQIEQAKGDEKVILVDAMGILTKCYQLAHLAIVGGSFYPQVGGHNILEPSAYGVPVLFGPYMYTQADFVSLVNEYQAGLQIPYESLATTLRTLIQSPSIRESLGQSGIKLYQNTQGASQKTLDFLESQFNLTTLLQEKSDSV